MAKYWDDTVTYAQPSAEELMRKARASMEAAAKKGQVLEPVICRTVHGEICQSWWGQAWCDNLESYADYESRLSRGKKYLRSGSVIDLKVRKGRVEARVQGTRKTPYKVTIKISPLSEHVVDNIIEKCSARIENMEALVRGEFPEELKDLFTSREGLFPSPREINFDCTCPDWASMCKHVAAVMYGIGVRFDENPFYFFALRGIDMERFIDVALQSRVESMLENAQAKTDRMMDDSALALFGVL